MRAHTDRPAPTKEAQMGLWNTHMCSCATCLSLSRSVEDWIWDPQTQRVLNKLKERLPDIEVAKAQDM
jgi:hypothetical protein